MRLAFLVAFGRRRLWFGTPVRRIGATWANEYCICDEVIGKCVGTVSIGLAASIRHQRYPARTIRLFDAEHISKFKKWNACLREGRRGGVELHARSEGREGLEFSPEPHAGGEGVRDTG
jgi:hypothetical protein